MQWLETRISELRSTVPERRAALEAERARYAKRHGLDRANMNQILNGKRRVGPTFLKVLGLRIVYAKDGNSD